MIRFPTQPEWPRKENFDFKICSSVLVYDRCFFLDFITYFGWKEFGLHCSPGYFSVGEKWNGPVGLTTSCTKFYHLQGKDVLETRELDNQIAVMIFCYVLNLVNYVYNISCDSCYISITLSNETHYGWRQRGSFVMVIFLKWTCNLSVWRTPWFEYICSSLEGQGTLYRQELSTPISVLWHNLLLEQR